MSASRTLRARTLAGLMTLCVCAPAYAAETPSQPHPLGAPRADAAPVRATVEEFSESADYGRRAQDAPPVMEDFTGGSTLIIGTTTALVVLGVVLLILIL
ncbi:MAG: hypothetical protein ACOYM9_11135 [Bradymonadia bacterium]